MPANITQTSMGADLDMTGFDLTGENLKDQILKDVKASQTFFGVHLPDKLIIRKDQFESIEHDTLRMEDTKDRLYRTPMNIMEVKVVHE